MSGLRPFLLILMASLFAFSGMARAAPLQASAAAPPCHEAPAQPAGHHDTSHQGGSKATLAVSCCIACIAAPQALPQPVGAGLAPARASYETAATDLRSRLLPPEPRPPRA
jgi:hypothetical protein